MPKTQRKKTIHRFVSTACAEIEKEKLMEQENKRNKKWLKDWIARRKAKEHSIICWSK